MTLQASGAIEVSDIRTELSESGAVNIGKTSFRDLAEVASGEIQISDFYGKSATPAVPNATMPSNYTTIAFKAFGTATAQLVMETAGDVEESKNGGARVDKGDWTDNNAAIVSADWEVQVTQTGETVSGSTVGSYIAMSTERSWTVSSSSGLKTAVLTVTIREIANTSNNATATITLNAEVS